MFGKKVSEQKQEDDASLRNRQFGVEFGGIRDCLDSARSGWRAAACEDAMPFPETCLCHTFRFPENAEAVRAHKLPSRRRRKTHWSLRVSDVTRQSLPLGGLRLLSSYSDGE